MIHEKKILPEPFERILEGKKHYELRLADWNCAKGDTLHLKEWDPEKETYTGREIKKAVTRVVRTKELKYWSEEEINKYGFQVLSLK